MAKSMKTAFIRVTKVNDTEQGPVTFTQECIKETLDAWSFSAGIDYWFIDHVPDDDDPNDHFHIVIKFRNPEHFETVKNKFPYGRIETAKNVKRAVQYLVHMNNPEKIQYKWEDVVTNVPDLSPFKVLSRSQHDVSLQRIFEQIESGEITAFNYKEMIPIAVYSKNKTIISNAIEHHINRLTRNVSRDIKVLYFYGGSGIGKTSFAKMYFDSLEYRFSVSSAGNDPLQDYNGEPGLLLDDFRDSSFAFSDLLKFLDPNTRSSGKSRYHNKDFIGDLIIITSTQRMDFLYKKHQCQTLDGGNEDMKQLRRRISEYYEFVDDKIKIYLYDKFADKYRYLACIDNPITKMIDAEPSNLFDPTPFENLGITIDYTKSVNVLNVDSVSSLPILDSRIRDLEAEKQKFCERKNEWGKLDEEKLKKRRVG